MLQVSLIMLKCLDVYAPSTVEGQHTEVSSNACWHEIWTEFAGSRDP